MYRQRNAETEQSKIFADLAKAVADEVAKRLGLIDRQVRDADPGLLTTDQTACRAGVCTETVRTWQKRPGFPSINIAKSAGSGHGKPVYRYRWAEVEAWLRQNGTVAK